MSIPESDKKYTYADYLTWPEGERWEIIDGTVYMQAAPSTVYQEILMELSRQIANHLRDKSCKVYPAPFCVRLTRGDELSDEDIHKELALFRILQLIYKQSFKVPAGNSIIGCIRGLTKISKI